MLASVHEIRSARLNILCWSSMGLGILFIASSIIRLFAVKVDQISPLVSLLSGFVLINLSVFLRRGYGLPLVKLIVELHGGDIFVESVVGRGTSFEIILPTKI